MNKSRRPKSFDTFVNENALCYVYYTIIYALYCTTVYSTCRFIAYGVRVRYIKLQSVYNIFVERTVYILYRYTRPTSKLDIF